MDVLIENARYHFYKQLFETNTLILILGDVASNTGTKS